MDALLLAVLNALWQAAALIALVAVALRWGLRRNATTACVVWSMTFAVVALLPVVDLVLARPAAQPVAKNPDIIFAEVGIARSPAARAVLAAPATTDRLGAGTATADGATVDGAAVTAAAEQSVVERIDAQTTRLGGAVTAFVRAWGIAIAGAWALIAALLLLRLGRAYAAIASMKRDATPLDDPAVLARLRAAGHRRRATVACSPRVTIPCAVGFRRPMILLPASLAASLEVDDLARVVLHESAHLQRYDDWINALEQVVCALQFFQPALYVARRGIDFEREVACDDRVLEDAGEPLRYAECLARIVQRHVRGPQAAVVPGFVLRRAQVVARVRRIVDRSRDASPHLRIGAIALGGGVLVATLGIARLQVPLVAPALAEPAQAAAAPASPLSATTVRNTLNARPHRTAHAHAAAAAKPVRPRSAGAAVVGADPVKPTVRVAPLAPLARVAPLAPLARVAPAAHVAPAARVAPTARVAPLAHVAPLARVAPVERAMPLRVAVPLHVDVSLPVAVSMPVVAPLPHVDSRTVLHLHQIARVTAAEAAQTAPLAVAQEARAAAAAAAVRFGDSEAPLAAAAHVLAQASAGTPQAPALVRISRSGGDLLDAIDEAKYPHPSVDELIALRNQGVTGDYVRAMGALGRSRPSLHDILALASQGVTPRYVAALDQRLATPPSLADVLALANQGVSSRYLDGMAALGYPKLTVNDAIALATQGCDVSYVRGLQEAGLRGLTPQQIVALRVQGVDGTFVRRMAAHGYRNLDVNALIRLKVSGFQP
jgi:beta-lactamase regulating signal transducer with metallopeptidase domain